MKVINVVLSGGVGSRLWPLSRKSKPKQYLPIFEGNSLFQKTVQRNFEYCDKILVVGNKENYLLSRKNLKDLGIDIYEEIIEAAPRNTAAAIAFAAFASNTEDILFVTPSDHLINNDDTYKKCVEKSIVLAKKGYLVTFGLNPLRPDTGYGYIESDGDDVKSFREKPDLQTAEAFLKSGNFLWNSGMFCFQAGNYLRELELLQPVLYQTSLNAFNSMKNGILSLEETLEIPSISVDYAVMEKTQKIKVVKSGFEWSDMGSFESVYDYFLINGHPIDGNGNMVIGTDLHTEFVGLEDTIFVYSEEAMLILQKSQSQKVKKVYERLEHEKPHLVK